MARIKRMACLAAIFVAMTTTTMAQELPEKQIALRDALRMGLENNLDLVSARLDPEISNLNIETSAANFDPSLNVRLNHSDTTREGNANALAANVRQFTSLNASVSQNLGMGGDYSVDFNNSRDASPGFQFNLVNPSWSSDISLNYGMELLAGRGKEAAQEQMILARGNADISMETLRQTTQTTMEAVEASYWDLVATIRGLDVSQQALGRSNAFLQQTQKQVEVGTMAPIEITQAEANVASQEESLIVAEVAMENAEDELRRLMGIPSGDSMWGMRMVPADEMFFEERSIDLASSIETAIDRSPNLVTARKTLVNRQLSERVARNRMRYGLRWDAGFTSAGDNFEPDLPNQRFNFGDAFNEIYDVDNYTYTTGLNLTIPIGNKANKANMAISRLNREKAELDIENQQRSIEVDVRRAVRAVSSGIKRVKAARANLVLQRKKLDAEQKKFENGMTTAFEVLTFQNDLANAELSEIQALVDYTKALTALERTKGTLLEYRNLSLMP